MADDNPSSAVGFVPPSIDRDVLRAGDSYTYYSPVPPLLAAPTAPTAPATSADTAPPAHVPCVLGIDEAGRGPVLGPMVYGVFYAPCADADTLLRGAVDPALRFDDSKVLAPATRSALLRAVCTPGTPLADTCGWAVALLSPRDISSGMLPPGAGSSSAIPASSATGANLNVQAAEATVQLVRGVLARGVRVTDVFVDTVGPPASYQAKLSALLPGLRITVAKKADSLYPSVSAASVCAKVTRDVALHVLAQTAISNGSNTPASWGSGYPSDARCTAWLRQNMHPLFGWDPASCRFSWGTAKDLLEAAAKKREAVAIDWPAPDLDDDNDPDNRFNVTNMTDFFAAPPAPGVPVDPSEPLGSWFGRPAGLAF